MVCVQSVTFDPGVVEDRKTRLQARIGVRQQQLFDSVVTGQRIRVAEVERIAGRSLQAPVQVPADRSAARESDVFEAIEGRGRQTVALQEPDRLAFHLRELSHLEKKGRPGGALEKIRLRTDAQTQLLGVDF